MKRLRLFTRVLFSIILCVSLTNALIGQEKQTVAILDFEGLGISQHEAQLLTNRLRTLLVQSKSYNVIERGQMEQILEEQNFQLSGCTSQECAVEVGQLLGAQRIMTGSIGKIGETFTVDLRIINVETSEIVRTASYDIRGEIDQMLTEGMVEVARRVSDNKELGAGPKYGTLSVFSQPGGARVFINDEERGTTPFSGTELTAGEEYTVEIALDGYSSYLKTLAIEEGDNPAINAELKPAWNWVTIQTNPKKASVVVDDVTVGKTPLDQLQYRVGKHTLEVNKKGFKPFRDQFEVQQSQPTVLNVQLKSKSRGTAFLLSMFVPGAGHFFRQKPLAGVFFMGVSALAGASAIDSNAQLQERYDEYQTLLNEYNQATDVNNLYQLEEDVWRSYDEMSRLQDERDAAVGLFTLVYGLNLITVVF